jgi:hypothetical protein
MGADIFSSRREAFQHLNRIDVLHPDPEKQQAYQYAYEKWGQNLQKELSRAQDL